MSTEGDYVNKVREVGPMTVLTVVTLVIIGVAALILRYDQSGYGEGRISIEGLPEMRVAVAANDRMRHQGLSGWESLGEYGGMMFVFPQPSKYVFWSDGMLFPIDVLWIDGNEIVDMTYDIEQPEYPDQVMTFSPLHPASVVLEVPAGFLRENGLRTGMKVDIKVDRRGRLR